MMALELDVVVVVIFTVCDMFVGFYAENVYNQKSIIILNNDQIMRIGNGCLLLGCY